MSPKKTESTDQKSMEGEATLSKQNSLKHLKTENVANILPMQWNCLCSSRRRDNHNLLIALVCA